MTGFDEATATSLHTLMRERASAVAGGQADLVVKLNAEIVDLHVAFEGRRLADKKLQSNEQVKYSATYVNTMAAGVFTAGVAAPVLGLFAPSSPFAFDLHLLGQAATGCFALSGALHLVARQILKRLRA